MFTRLFSALISSQQRQSTESLPINLGEPLKVTEATGNYIKTDTLSKYDT